MTPEQRKHLNRPLGYEIASLLIDSTLSFSKIKDKLPRENVNDNAVRRILEDYDGDPEIFTVPKTRGGKKHTLNTQSFSEQELRTIRERAAGRITDNRTEDNGDQAPQDTQPAPHTDVANMPSRFA